PRDAVVSGELAAEALISYLPAERAVIHVLSAEAWAEVENWKDSRSSFLGERDQLFVDRADPGVAHFGEERDGLALVSPVQLYVDLYADRGRGREAAEQVRRELLRF
ncbi:MAG TPA: type IV toxin-antitoxin system AbiEi family antitoxin, partial [Acidimicrobiia bacterium]|nr:type IV toxin-antitoxin system AbiEi family antitoxin [Acidimicrobiia bacterium]